MSDFSLLYKKYNSVSNLTNDLNNSVITLKRKNLASIPANREKLPNLSVDEKEVIKANNQIVEVLSLLEEFYNKQETSNELYELMDNSFFQNQILRNVVFREDILRVLKKAKENTNLSAKDLATIDKFISILDNEASVLFKKLRTSRA
jgi:hypothetical protein